eukprot:CAMPEP_0184488614 /NCGR_PEP_ID=MMETSP0113_2-20130426/12721_1 /TAXON_ID=91329 /ORGANISM="Norrisiella sphaerica, Strain BC52" /LENGTH=312 /DNA_ID=CAMNT_0026871515 /DNA_START=374 /DNA_END=1312 /DNA_ORIENTATION=+
MKRYLWVIVQRACWMFVGLPLFVVFGAASSYFMGALTTVDLYRYVFPLDAVSNNWLVLAVVLFSTIVASIGCVISMGLMACVWAYPVNSMRFLYSTFALIGVMGAGQFGMSAAQAYALGDAIADGKVYHNVKLDMPVRNLSDAAAIEFAAGIQPYPLGGSSTWAPDLNYATQICVAPLMKKKKSGMFSFLGSKKDSRSKACFWAVAFGSSPTKGCEPPSRCLGGQCKGTTAESRQYKYYVDDAIRRSVSFNEQFDPCEEYIAITLRDHIDLKSLQHHAYSVARMWLMGGFVAALAMSVCLTVLCRRVVWWNQ